jgi:hypothetical protein
MKRVFWIVIHNCVAHPFLVVADLLVLARLDRLATPFDQFHDWSAKKGYPGDE